MRNRIKNLSFHLILILAISLSSFNSGAQTTYGKLTVKVTGIKNPKGLIIMSLYDKEDGFPNDIEKSIQRKSVRMKDGKCTIVFNQLPYGIYAIGVIHDENSNGKMDKYFIGMPKEGVGASNNAKGSFGPPKFSDAKFSLKSKNITLNINMVYL